MECLSVRDGWMRDRQLACNRRVGTKGRVGTLMSNLAIIFLNVKKSNIQNKALKGVFSQIKMITRVFPVCHTTE